MRTLAPLHAAIAAVLTLTLVLYPEVSLQAAKEGMDIFFRIVFPSLLPFFVLSEIMLGLGVVHFIGVLFEPLMRPVFNVPGKGAFVLSMGLAAGYPMDAVITAKFRRGQMCSRVEGERMLAFTNTADPLFIFGAVAVGMFGLERLGGTLALAHYLGALVVGLMFRFYGWRDRPTAVTVSSDGPLLRRALDSLVEARQADARSFGQLMGDAVNDSIKTLFMICGFIILFAVAVKVLSVVGLDRLLALPLVAAFQFAGVDLALVPAALAGFFEIDLGTAAAAKAPANLVQQALVASAIIAWSGLSVHAQVASVLAGTDIRMGPYVLARLLHAVFAAVFTVWLLSGPGWAAAPASGLLPQLDVGAPHFWLVLQRAAAWALLLPVGLFLVGGLAALATQLVRAIFRPAP